MRLSVSFRVTNHTNGFSAAVERELEQAVVRSVMMVRAKAAQAAPVDTGALKNSIHTVTKRSSGYASAMARAQARPKRSSRTGEMVKTIPHVFPEVKPRSAFEGICAVGVEYGAAQEFGIGRSGAHPYMRPAIEHVRPLFQRMVSNAARRALRNAT